MREIVILLIVMLAVTCQSKPLTAEEEMIDQLLSIREDILQFTRIMEAKKEMPTHPPWQPNFPSPCQPNMQHVHGGEKTSQQKVPNEDILQKVTDYFSTAEVRSSTPIASHEPERRFQAQFLAMMAGGK